MYLKSLDITGFKSFPEKTQLKFSSGITAAVGPNGCGKSNLVDAIRWALGEQSAKLLRGSKMDDFIFSGTARRKALNFAEVSLTFDKADKYLPLDYQEIVITRRMYRSGEGEYYLNKTPCRLRDITELFLDTGIGKETYSLIGQGRVEQLINARPEEHRELFEEAAEIHKYKQRKKEARTRLEEMNKNLLRVEDILAELKNQSVPLSEAAARAGEYRDLSHNLKEIEKTILVKRWWENNCLLQKVNIEMQKIYVTLQEKKDNLEAFRKRTSGIEQQENVKQVEINEVKELYQQQKEKLEKLQGQLTLIKEQKKYSREKKFMKEGSCKEVLGRISGLEETCRKNEAELKSVLLEQEQLGEKAAGLKAALEQLQKKTNLLARDELRQQKAEKNLQKAALEQFLESNRQRTQELWSSINEIEEREKNKNRDLDTLQKVEKEAIASLQRLKWDRLDKNKEHELLEQRRQDFYGQRKMRKDELTSLEREWQKKSARLKYLRESEDDLSLYASGVRAVMHDYLKDPSEKGIYGPVANLINVPPEFEKALEVALGAKIQFIVTSDDLSARKAIEFLKGKKAGKATFLPLNLLKPAIRRDLPSPVPEDFCEVASRLVETPARFKKAVEYLLGGVLVAKNLEAALKLARNNKAGWRIVTLEGEMITPGGAISGGYHSEERSGFLQRKREFKNLEMEIMEIEKQNKQKSMELEIIENSITEVEKSFKELDLQGRKLEEEKTRVQTDLTRIGAEKSGIREEITHLAREKSRLLEKLHELAEQETRKEEDYKLLEESLAAVNVELENLSRQVKVDEEHYKNLEKELVEIRVRFSALQEKESSLQEALLKQVQEKERLDEIAAGLIEEKGKLQAELKDLEAAEDRAANGLEKERGKIQNSEGLLEQLNNDLKCCKQLKEELFSEAEREQKALERSERRRQNVNIELIKLEEAGKYLEESLQEKFKINPEKEISFDSLTGKAEEVLLKERELLEEKILSLGEVDPGAIDEYERLQNRISFLEGQREDLLSGEMGIKKILGELDQHMEKKFLQALQSIGKNFFDIFSQLFGGGQAFLKLTGPDNILESGIEIIAQPPGKKFQSISLLSGGEKALTAIALLFALLQYKPVPFCVLDEIDSSLDESNLSRYVHFLKRYVTGTQFIIITHRRKTMEEADVLYGITMEEQGVSKVVSLNLNQKAG
ncbi:MAG: chromosome segregation protein SMC [Dethiobacter sp.]|jgi:chromosome segregation protein|nr:MAG: chromosome segregation protein SMC [Dethiobacter sp.]